MDHISREVPKIWHYFGTRFEYTCVSGTILLMFYNQYLQYSKMCIFIASLDILSLNDIFLV